MEAALCFYKALKVYPTPMDLMGIYDKTVPKVCPEPDRSKCLGTNFLQHVLDLLAEMIAADPNLMLSSNGGGSDSGIPSAGLD